MQSNVDAENLSDIADLWALLIATADDPEVAAYLRDFQSWAEQQLAAATRH